MCVCKGQSWIFMSCISCVFCTIVFIGFLVFLYLLDSCITVLLYLLGLLCCCIVGSCKCVILCVVVIMYFPWGVVAWKSCSM
jgi:hypothetical protein